MPTTSPNPISIHNPIDPPNPNPISNLTPSFFIIIILHSPEFELQTSDFEVHLHLHYGTQATVANLLIFVGLIS